MIGFNDFAFGLLGAIPFIATFGQLFATVFIERTGLKKYLFLKSGFLHRGIWLLIAAVPLLLPIPTKAAVTLVLILAAISWFMASLSTPAWLTWMGDLIPRRIRGRYMANRARLSQAVQIVAVIGIGIVVDVVVEPGVPQTVQAQPALFYLAALIIAAGAVCGIIDILLFRRIREVLRTDNGIPKQPVLRIDFARPNGKSPIPLVGFSLRYLKTAINQLLFQPLKDRSFRSYVGFGSAIIFMMTVAGWYFWLLAIEHLGFSNLATNVLFLVIGPVVGIISAKFWGKLNDLWGRRITLMLALGMMFFSLVPWFFATPQMGAPEFLVKAINWISGSAGALVGKPGLFLVGSQTPLGAYLLCMCGVIIGACCWTGINIAQIGIMLGFSDGDGRSKYLAASSVWISLGGILGGLSGGFVAQSLHFLQENPIGPFLWNNWHATLALSFLARIVAFGWVLRMPETSSRSVKHLIRGFGFNFYNAVVSRLFYPGRVLGRNRFFRNHNNNNGRNNRL